MAAVKERPAPGLTDPTGAETAVLTVRDLRMRYGKTDVLDGVSFTARPGRCSPCSGPTAPARPRRSRSLRASGCGRPARSGARRRPGPWRGSLAGPASAWCCSRGATTANGGSASCSLTSAPTTRPTRPRGSAVPWDTDELIATVGPDRARAQADRQLSGGQRRRLDVAIGIVGPARAAVPRRANGGLRPGRHGASSMIWCTGCPTWRTPPSC